MRNFVLALGLSLAVCSTALANHRHNGGSQQDSFKFGEAGSFGWYTLEMSYEVDFCASHQDKPECAGGGNFASPMTLHGLWPDHDNDPQFTYSFCGLNQDPMGNSDWCDASFDQRKFMSSNVYAALAAVMPGANGSCLYNHEWFRHGTCSGMGVDAFFQASATVASKFQSFHHFADFLRANAGEAVTASDLANALQSDMGEEGMASVKFICRKQRNEPRFSAVDINIDKDHLGEFPAASSFVPLKQGPASNDCPATGIVLTAPSSS